MYAHAGALATQPTGTSVVYTATTAVITMPISNVKLPWSMNKPWDTVALCCHIHPMYMLTGVFTYVSLTVVGALVLCSFVD